MSSLERRVRLLLRAYPSRWRDERGEDLVATVLDVSGPDRQWPSVWMAADLVVGGLVERAHQHKREAGGWLASGWRTTTVIAVVIQVAVVVLWAQQWLTDGFVPMLPVIGNASAITYVVALVGLPLAAGAWLAGWERAAKVLSAAALLCWAVTVFVFQMALAGGTRDLGMLVAWTYLAVLAAWALWQPRPTYPRAVAALTAALVVGTLAGSIATSAPGMQSGQLQIAGLARIQTLPGVMILGWAGLALIGLLMASRDPRPVIAASLLLPFAALLHPPALRPLALGVAVLGVAVVGAAIAATRQTDRAR